MRVADFTQKVFATAGNNDLVAEFVEGLGESPTNAGGAAGDEDRVRMHAHKCVREV